MTIYIGADHRGYHLAAELTARLAKEYTVHNLSSSAYNPEDDYVDFAAAVGKKIAADSESLGIVICGGGSGICIAANKIHGIRCALGFTPKQVKAARNDDDANMLALPSDFIDTVEAEILVKAFLETPFSGEERHKRRIQKVKELE